MKNSLLFLSHADSFDLGSKTEFTDAFLLVIVPQKDLIGMELGSISASDKGEDITAEEHFHDGDAAAKF